MAATRGSSAGEKKQPPQKPARRGNTPRDTSFFRPGGRGDTTRPKSTRIAIHSGPARRGNRPRDTKCFSPGGRGATTRPKSTRIAVDRARPLPALPPPGWRAGRFAARRLAAAPCAAGRAGREAPRDGRRDRGEPDVAAPQDATLPARTFFFRFDRNARKTRRVSSALAGVRTNAHQPTV